MILNKRNKKDIFDLGFEIQDLFLPEHQLQTDFVLNQDSSKASLNYEKQQVKIIFDQILSKYPDKGLKESINASLKKQLNEFKKIQKKIIRFEKQKYQLQLSKISTLKGQLFPKGVLQERYENLIPFYLEYGDNFIEILKNSLNPLDPNFVVLSH